MLRAVANLGSGGGGGGSPGGSNTQIQYNAAGSFGGITGATSDGTSLTFASGNLKLSGASSGTSLLNASATGGGTATLPAGSGTLVYAAGAVTSIAGTANQITASASTGAVTLSTPSDFRLPGTINLLTLTQPATGATLTLANNKAFTVSNTLTLAGTDSTVMTFPSTSATIARTDAANTFTGTQTIGALVATTVNGNTFTTGTGVLTIAASKTLTVSNTLTLAGTDTSTLNIGAGGTLGSNAFTSTAYAPAASPTFTGTVTLPDSTTITSSGHSALTLTGALAVAFSTTGVKLKQNAATITDSTTGAGTLATTAVDYLASPTLATAANAITVTNAYHLYVQDPIAGTNVTMTNKWSAGFDSLTGGTAQTFKVTAAGVMTAAAGTINGTFTTTGTVTLATNSLTVSSSTGHSSGANTSCFAWSSTSVSTGTIDTTISRNAAGVVQIGASTGAAASGSLLLATLTASGNINLKTTTVGALGSAATVGATAFVTDANTTLILGLGLTAVGGGANKVPVYADGSNWIVG